jgi:hypothetical protein
MVEAFSAMLTGTRLEDDLADLLWSFVNLFHRKTDRVERELDVNEQAQRRGQAEQDGSEVKSVELERLIAQGLSLIERRNAFEFVRDHAAEHYDVTTGSAWRPRAGSMVNHRALTASVIDSREFIAPCGWLLGLRGSAWDGSPSLILERSLPSSKSLLTGS